MGQAITHGANSNKIPRNLAFCLSILLGKPLAAEENLLFRPTPSLKLLGVAEIESNDFTGEHTWKKNSKHGLKLKSVEIKLKGALPNASSYKVSYDLRKQYLGKAWVTLPAAPFAVLIGQDTTFQGGLETAWDEYEWMVYSPFLTHQRPFKEHEPMVQLQWRGLKIAVLNDKIIEEVKEAETQGYGFTHSSSLTAMFEWTEPLGESFTPLVQGGVYQRGRSAFVEVGGRLALGQVDVGLDCGLDRRERKYPSSSVGQTTVSGKDLLSTVSFFASYKPSSSWNFYGKGGRFKVQQFANTQERLFDQQGNSAVSLPTTLMNGAYYNDNAVFWTLGASYMPVAAGLQYFLAVASLAGDFFTTASAVNKVTKTELGGYLGLKLEI